MKLSPNLVLRIALTFTFLYPAIAALIAPDNWVTFFPSFLLAAVPNTLLLYGWSVVEVIIALWILSGKHIFLPSLVAALALIGIVVFNFSLFDIVFRDLALAGVAIALALQSYKNRTNA